VFVEDVVTVSASPLVKLCVATTPGPVIQTLLVIHRGPDHEGIIGRGDLDPAVYGWTDPVAEIEFGRASWLRVDIMDWSVPLTPQPTYSSITCQEPGVRTEPRSPRRLPGWSCQNFRARYLARRHYDLSVRPQCEGAGVCSSR
jgi:hypothetical protein